MIPSLSELQNVTTHPIKKWSEAEKLGLKFWLEYLLRVKDLTFDNFEPSWCGGRTRLARWLGAWPSRALNNKNWNRNHWLLVIQVLRSKCVLPFKLLKKANLANLSLGGRLAGGLAEAPNNKNWNSNQCLLVRWSKIQDPSMAYNHL